VPDLEFSTDLGRTFCNAVNWLQGVDLDGFICQDKQTQLFGNTPEQWSIDKARQFINALTNLWNNWE
jgi:hypothetical protein